MLSQCHSPIQETLLELQFYFNWWEYPEVRSQKIWESLICLIFIKFFERSNQIYWEDLSIWERARLALRANKYEMMKRSGKIELGLIDFIQQKEMKKSHSDKLTEIWPDITIKNYCLEISLLEFKLAKSVAGKFN